MKAFLICVNELTIPLQTADCEQMFLILKRNRLKHDKNILGKANKI